MGGLFWCMPRFFSILTSITCGQKEVAMWCHVCIAVNCLLVILNVFNIAISQKVVEKKCIFTAKYLFFPGVNPLSISLYFCPRKYKKDDKKMWSRLENHVHFGPPVLNYRKQKYYATTFLYLSRSIICG
jgi:hypothetical protein